MGDTTQVSQLAQGVGEVLDQLGTRFGATGAHLWEQLVRYQYTEALTGVGVIVFLWVLLICVAVATRGKDLMTEETYPELTTWGMVRNGTWIALAVVVVVTIISTVNLVPTLLAPEAATLRSLIK